jgi:hypothetical protein
MTGRTLIVALAVLAAGIGGCGAAGAATDGVTASGSAQTSAASGAASPADQPTTLATDPTAPPVATAAGIGFTDSEPIALKAGDYLIRWTISTDDPSGCPAIGALHTKDGKISLEFANTTLSGPGEQSGERPVPGLTAGTYLITIATTCSWTAAVYLE